MSTAFPTKVTVIVEYHDGEVVETVELSTPLLYQVKNIIQEGQVTYPIPGTTEPWSKDPDRVVGFDLLISGLGARLIERKP